MRIPSTNLFTTQFAFFHGIKERGRYDIFTFHLVRTAGRGIRNALGSKSGEIVASFFFFFFSAIKFLSRGNAMLNDRIYIYINIAMRDGQKLHL